MEYEVSSIDVVVGHGFVEIADNERRNPGACSSSELPWRGRRGGKSNNRSKEEDAALECERHYEGLMRSKLTIRTDLD